VFLRLVVLLTIASLFTYAQEDARKLKIDVSRPLRIDYVAPSWNKDPDKIDNAALLIRDANTGQMAKVEMTETEKNSAFFVGVYQLSFQEKTDITPEIYIAPQQMLKADQQLSRISALIKEGNLLRKPYFLRTEKRNQVISVFDSRAQAVEAYQSFMKTGAGRPLIDPAAFDAQRAAQKSAEERQRLEAAFKAEQTRMKLEAEERLRQEEMKKKMKALDAAERERRKKQAAALDAQGMAAFQKQDFKTAEEKFNKAVDLDPENSSHNFPYGVSLFKNEKYNRAIVILKLANGKGFNPNERDYLIGASHQQLKEYEQASRIFNDVKDKGDKIFSPLSAFSAGIIDYQKENYESAKKNFEFVLDNSEDPKLDQQAETYIEQIANIMRFEEMKKKKWILSANLGLQYDSNILSVSAANAPTDMAGYRWSYGGSVEYRPVFSEKQEWSAILSLSDMYSTDKNFQAKTDFQNVDPLVMNLSLPYKWKGEALGKPAQLGLTPAYETIYLNADATGSREAIVNSIILKGDGTLVMSDDYFPNYSVEIRRDNSLLGVTGDEDQTANKITLSTTQTTFQDKKKSKALIWDGSVAMNMAEGNNQKYNRLDLGASYMMPSVWETTFLSRLALGYSDYGSHTTGRKDTTYTLMGLFQKPINDDLGTSLTLIYIKNNSTLESSAYDKYTLMLAMNWKKAF
jgi:hypothetical protein